MPGCRPGVVAAGPRDFASRNHQMDSSGVAPESPVCRTSVFLLDDEPKSLASGSRGTRTHKRREAATCFQNRLLIRPDDFREGYRAKFRGLESNQRPPRSERGVTTTSNCPGFGKEDSNLHRLIQSQGAYPLADSRERPAGVEPACRAWKARA